MFKIPTHILKNVSACTNDKIRVALQATCFDFDEKKNELRIVATNAQVLIVYTMAIEQDDIEFCKKWFSDNHAYFIPQEVLKSKSNYVFCTEINGMIAMDGVILKELDVAYARWQAILPQNGTDKAHEYCGFDKDLVKIADKAWGFTGGNTIMKTRPDYVLGAGDEYLSPHIWKDDWAAIKKTLIVMPLRLDNRN